MAKKSNIKNHKHTDNDHTKSSLAKVQLGFEYNESWTDVRRNIR